MRLIGIQDGGIGAHHPLQFDVYHDVHSQVFEQFADHWIHAKVSSTVQLQLSSFPLQISTGVVGTVGFGAIHVQLQS